MKKTMLLLLSAFVCLGAEAKKVKFDFSLVFVPEEGGVKFEKITDDADYVATYDGWLVKLKSKMFGSGKYNNLSWWVIPQIGVSPDGKRIGYINEKNKTTNIMITESLRIIRRLFSYGHFGFRRDGFGNTRKKTNADGNQGTGRQSGQAPSERGRAKAGEESASLSEVAGAGGKEGMAQAFKAA